MCVSGLILDPEVPIRALFTSPSVDNPLQPTNVASVGRPVPTTSAQRGRKRSLLHRFRDFYGNAARPFALSNRPPRYHSSPVATSSAATSSVTLVGPAPLGRKRTDTSASLLEKIPSSSSNLTGHSTYTQHQREQKDALILPFQFSVNLSRGITRRHLPYLRHSWTRTDGLSVIGFWISFVLAEMGVEHGSRHIGLFRALSVLRTARLLAITSGTTVSDTSL
jgi:voltage-dependent calcium channel